MEVLSWGSFEIDKGLLVYGKEAAYGVKVNADLVSLYVETGDARMIIDTGIGDVPQARRGFIRTKGIRSASDVLAPLGLAPQDITHVVNTHLHFDHAGGNHAFASAGIFAQRREIEYALKPHRFQRNAYWREALDTRAMTPLDGHHRITDDVTVVPTPGHTPGHQSVVVAGPAGNLVFTGDACPLRENFEKRNIVGVLHDPVEAEKSLEILRTLGARFVFSHEPGQSA
jgi:glyoxylase-like metal-dependent hydrolase (beta-lactamase superfamily II)